MSFGLTPKFTETLLLEGVTAPEYLMLAKDASLLLGWKVGHETPTSFTAFTGFNMRSGHEKVQVTAQYDEVELRSETTTNQVIDWGKNKKNIQNLEAGVEKLHLSYTEEMVKEKLAVREALSDPAITGQMQQPATKGTPESFFSFFVPREKYFITPILIDMNILIFLLMVVAGISIWSPDRESMIQWGANFKPVTLDGQWWRLLTSCFLHFGIFHLLMNMYALLYIGLMLEPYLGKLRFAVAYLLCGIMSSITSLWWHDLTISAGASGAIFGMYGVFLAMLTTSLVEAAQRKALLTSMLIFVGYNLLNGMKGGIDNAAHIGGLITGLVTGYVYYPGLKKPQQFRYVNHTLVLLTVLVFFTSFMIYRAIPNDISLYEKNMQQLSMLENKALHALRLPGDTPKEERLSALQQGITDWNKAEQIIRTSEKLQLPPIIRERDKELLHYCDLRLKVYQWVYLSVNENSGAYLEQIREGTREIKQSLIKLRSK